MYTCGGEHPGQRELQCKDPDKAASPVCFKDKEFSMAGGDVEKGEE